jgi:hypothetical protein
MSDIEKGDIRPDILNEKVMSAIVEIKVPIERAEEVIRLVWGVEKKLNTIVVLGVGVRCDANGEDNVILPMLHKLGYNPARAKTNMGLGRKVLRDLAKEPGLDVSQTSGDKPQSETPAPTPERAAPSKELVS